MYDIVLYQFHNKFHLDISGRDLIAGTRSFGALLEEEGYYAVPSPRQPFPGII